MNSYAEGKRLIVRMSGRIDYYSKTQGQWRQEVSNISLDDICGLTSNERDVVLIHWRRMLYPRLRARKRVIDLVDKVR